ncbi:MAG: hypothetical protein HIU91_04360 [Acidobacteria bacterium]|nr:hypothetical protein [Acidobacteriota bacterium]
MLETRGMVLQKSGYGVSLGSKLSDVEHLEVDQIDLLMFCHTVSLPEIGRVIALAQARWPDATALFLSAGEVEWPTRLPSEVVDAMCGPEKLIATVGRMVGGGGGSAEQHMAG